MSKEYRFTIKYHGDKASRLVSGNLSRSQICSIFKDDLTALGVNHPKMEKIRYDSFGSIYFTYMLDKNNYDPQHKRYQTVELTQYKDPNIFNVKASCSIQHITTMLEKNAPTWESPRRVKREHVSRTIDADKSDHFKPGSSPREPSSKERFRKRPRLSMDSNSLQSSDRPSLTIDPKASALSNGKSSASQASPREGHTTKKTSPQISIKVEEEESSMSAILNPPSPASVPPTKTFISLNTKSTNSKTPSGPRHNALTTYAKSQEVNRLTRELWDTRRVLSAAQARETSLIKDLQKLTPINFGNIADNEEQLADIKARLASSENEVAAERTRRLRAEQRLKDVERECKSPFVVPALLKAFITISQMTDDSIVPSLVVDGNERTGG